MAGTVPKITPGSLTIEHALNERPIYFVTVGGVRLVIKGDAVGSDGYNRTDADTAASIKWSAKLMKGVNSKLVNTKIMTPEEITVFLQAARAKYAANTAPGKNVMAVGGPTYTWVKMPRVEGLSDAAFLDHVDGQRFPKLNLSKARAAVIKFTDESVWPQLGKVLAVDIFNGNNDRFDVGSGDWVNHGNIMFVDEGAGHTSVIGLDTFNPNQNESNLVKHGRFDELRILNDDVKQREFANNATKSVGKTLARELFGSDGTAASKTIQVPDGLGGYTLWSFTKKELEDLYLPHSAGLAAGIAKGALELKALLTAKVRDYKGRADLAAHAKIPLPVPPPRPTAAPMTMPPLPMPPLPPAPGMAAHTPKFAAPLPPPPGRPQPPAMISRQRAGAALPPAPNLLTLHAAPIPGIPQGILDRMAFLGWLPR